MSLTGKETKEQIDAHNDAWHLRRAFEHIEQQFTAAASEVKTAAAFAGIEAARRDIGAAVLVLRIAERNCHNNSKRARVGE